jgi:predicted permease
MNNLRYAARTLLKNPGFALVAILTLALGIGANTAIFSVVHGVLLRPLPYPDAAAIVQVWTTSAAEPKSGHAPADFLELQRDNRTLLALAGYRDDALTVTTPGGEPVRVQGDLVTVDYFAVFGVPALLGRTFDRAADAATSEPLAVLSHALWTAQLASDPDVAGARVRINGVPHTVIGVMPPSFDYPEGAKAWVLSPKPVPLPPIDVAGDLLESRGVHYFQAVGRLRPGIEPEQARADLAALAAGQAGRFPDSNSGRGIAIERLHQKIVGDVDDALLMLLAAVGLVLLIACANVASLLLARASRRQREIAIRAALGAGRRRLIRQMITESLLLGAAGGAAGLLAGGWAIALLLAVMPEGIPRAGQIGLDPVVAGLAILVSFASALLFGLVPALQGSRTDASLVLRESDRAATGGRRRARTRAVLVVSEIALTVVLVVSAGLLATSLVRLRHVDPGFQVEDVALAFLPLPHSKYPDGRRQAAFYQGVLEDMQQRREIQSAAVLFPNPIAGGNASGTFTVEGRPVSPGRDQPFTAIASVSDDYFRTLGIAVIQGRTFGPHDREPAPAVAIVNATLARRYLAGREAIGARVRFGESDDDWITIAGIVADSRNQGLNQVPSALLYLPYHRFPLAFMSIAARSPAGPGAVASIVREAVKRADPDMPVDTVEPLAQILRDSMAEPRFRTQLLGAFALMAVVLAAVGVYGLISFSVAQRTREIGIRVALGAQPRQVMAPVLLEGVWLALTGIAIGAAGALAAARLLADFLFGVGPADPLTYAGVAALLLAVALAASYIPSRRALRVDPITALRGE